MNYTWPLVFSSLGYSQENGSSIYIQFLQTLQIIVLPGWFDLTCEAQKALSRFYILFSSTGEKVPQLVGVQGNVLIFLGERILQMSLCIDAFLIVLYLKLIVLCTILFVPLYSCVDIGQSKLVDPQNKIKLLLVTSIGNYKM